MLPDGSVHNSAVVPARTRIACSFSHVENRPSAERVDTRGTMGAGVSDRAEQPWFGL